MSTAAAFRFREAFPFCPVATSPGANFDYIGSLSLATIMSWWWNTEDLSLTTAGDVNGSSLVGTLGLNPLTHSGPFNSSGAATVTSNIIQDPSGGGWPGSSTPIPPRDRVCWEIPSFLALANSTGSSPVYTGVFWDLTVRIDPGDASLFALYYRMSINTDLSSADAVAFRNPAYGSPGSGVSLKTSTSFSISGLSFNVDIYTKGTTSSEGISGARGVYTY